MPLLQVNDRLTLGNKFRGTVRYIGEIKSREGKWIGLELDDPVGANDGSVNGVRYFQCMEQHGIFVRYEKIKAGLTCETRSMNEPDGLKDESDHHRQAYEAKVRKLEETIETLRNVERDEILELRRENNEIKKIILDLQDKLSRRDGLSVPSGRHVPRSTICSEVKELIIKSNTEISGMMEIVSDMQRCRRKKKAVARAGIEERNKVLFLISRIIDGILDDDMEEVECFAEEFWSIMEKYDISAE